MVEVEQVRDDKHLHKISNFHFGLCNILE